MLESFVATCLPAIRHTWYALLSGLVYKVHSPSQNTFFSKHKRRTKRTDEPLYAAQNMRPITRVNAA